MVERLPEVAPDIPGLVVAERQEPGAPQVLPTRREPEAPEQPRPSQAHPSPVRVEGAEEGETVVEQQLAVVVPVARVILAAA